jgi:hypothetical protein
MPALSRRLPAAGGASIPAGMTGKSGKTGAAKSGDPRAERLKAALRENLKRRKAQARGRAEETGSSPSSVRPRESGDPGVKCR